MFEILFDPLYINKTEIPNRIIYPSLGLLYSYDGSVSDRYVEFYRERARGGAGMVTMGPVGFDHVGAGLIAPSLQSDEAIPDFKKVTDAIHESGAKAWIQLYHAGAYSYSFLIGGEKAVAPSAIPSRYTRETPREMTLEDIETVQDAFVKGAIRAREAGFDGVEIIGSAGYLITQFLSPLKNQRSDHYGGSFENRTRFPREVIEKMRKALGPDYPITIRMAGNDFVPGSNTSRETPEFARVYEEAGIDAINVTGGWHESRVPQLPMTLPRGAFTYLAREIRDAVSIPVAASNRITDPYMAEDIIKDGLADMVSLGRVLIADPYWPRKTAEGRPETIRPCIACSQGCTDSLFAGKPVYCAVNPEAGYESERKIPLTDDPKHVMVIGAGPGGLEAAITAARMGHRVSLYESGSEIGGQLWIAGTPPHKQEIWSLIDYFEEMIHELDIDLILNTEVDEVLISKINPDYIISAQGGRQLPPPITGIDSPRVMSAWDLLDCDLPTGKRIAIIGGGAVGLETAHFLAAKGTITPETLHFLFTYNAEEPERLRELVTKGTKEVTVFELQKKAGQGVGKSTKWVLFGDLEKLGVEVLTEINISEIIEGLIKYTMDGKEMEREFDTIVFATGTAPNNTLQETLEKLDIPWRVIGDATQPGTMDDAIHAGYLAALETEGMKAKGGAKV